MLVESALHRALLAMKLKYKIILIHFPSRYLYLFKNLFLILFFT